MGWDRAIFSREVGETNVGEKNWIMLDLWWIYLPFMIVDGF